MALFGRRDRPPAEIVQRLDAGERVLAWADTADASVVATTLGVWWPDADGPRRMLWQHIDKVVWRDGVLNVVEADVIDDELLVERSAVSVVLTVPRDLPPLVRKRIEANVVKSEVLAVPEGAVRFVARRLPGRDGVAWWARLEPGTRGTEQVRSAIRARLARLREDSARHAGQLR